MLGRNSCGEVPEGRPHAAEHNAANTTTTKDTGHIVNGSKRADLCRRISPVTGASPWRNPSELCSEADKAKEAADVTGPIRYGTLRRLVRAYHQLCARDDLRRHGLSV